MTQKGMNQIYRKVEGFKYHINEKPWGTYHKITDDSLAGETKAVLDILFNKSKEMPIKFMRPNATSDERENAMTYAHEISNDEILKYLKVMPDKFELNDQITNIMYFDASVLKKFINGILSKKIERSTSFLSKLMGENVPISKDVLYLNILILDDEKESSKLNKEIYEELRKIGYMKVKI